MGLDGGTSRGGAPCELAALRWPQLDGRAPVLLVPVGSTEQHGPHLPLATDTLIATAVADAVRDRLDASGTAAAVAPGVAYGASGEHEAFPGTVSIGHEALRLLLVEYARSACRWADRVVFVNGHGGNVPTLVDVVELLRYEGRRATWTACAPPGGDAHAGRTETSLLLHLAPALVHREHAAPGATAPLAALMPVLRRDGVRAVSPNGVLGDPAGASAQEGRRLFAAMVGRVVDDLDRCPVGGDRPATPASGPLRRT